MTFVGKLMKLQTRTKVILAAAFLVVVAIGILLWVYFSQSGYLATTMRLLRVEGTVNIEDAKGNSKPVIDNIRFQSGDALSTGSDGLASVGLDDTKIVTLKSDSRAEFVKNKKKIELKLTKGALFFEVTEKLKSDETYEIKTSTMTAGIRGTSGYVFYDENGRESLVITDGIVHVIARNPDTGEVKEIDVYAGQEIKVYLYSDRQKDSVEFFLNNLKEEDVPAFSLKMLAEDRDLLAKVCTDTGWSEQKILDLVHGLLNPENKDPENTPTPVPTPNLTPTVTISPTPKPEVSVTPEVSPTLTPTPEVTPTLSPTPSKPTTEPTPTPTPEVTPTLSPAPATPTTEPTPSPTTEPTPTPTMEPTPTPTTEPTPTPTTEPTPTPTTEPTPTPTTEPTPTPTTEPTPTPTTKPTPTPTTKPTPTPTTKPSPTPTTKPTPTPTTKPTPTPTTKPTPTPTTKPTPTPTTKPSPTPTKKASPTPTKKPSPTPSTSPSPSPSPVPDIPDRENPPEGYREEVVWDEEEMVFILWGAADEEDEPGYIGYLNGDWIHLDCTVQETADGFIETYTYERDGETIIYYQNAG